MSDIRIRYSVPGEGHRLETQEVDLAELEPFFRALSGIDGPDYVDERWSRFKGLAAAEADEDGSTYLSHIISESGAAMYVDWKDSGEAYAQSQALCRKLGVGRMPLEYRPMGPNDIFGAVHDWLQRHGMACYNLPLDGDAHCALVVRDPALVNAEANSVGIVLRTLPPPTPEDLNGYPPAPTLPVDPSHAGPEITDLRRSIDRVTEQAGGVGISNPGILWLRTNRRVRLAILQYSAGMDPAEVRSQLRSALEFALADFEDPNERIHATGLEAVALARLLHLDGLVDRVIGGVGPGKTVRLRVIFGQGDSTEFTTQGLAEMHDTWRDNLPARVFGFREPETAYLGSWDFETAAVAKLTGTNDFDLRSMPMYPGDLVDFEA